MLLSLWPDWAADGSCRNQPTEMFFAKGTAMDRAKRVCAACPVRPQCLDWSMTLPEHTAGIFAGLSSAQRERWRKRGGPAPAIRYSLAARRPLPEKQQKKAPARNTTKRGNANGRKTACKRGHPFTPANTLHYRGRRVCRTCARLRARGRLVPVQPGGEA